MTIILIIAALFLIFGGAIFTTLAVASVVCFIMDMRFYRKMAASAQQIRESMPRG